MVLNNWRLKYKEKGLNYKLYFKNSFTEPVAGVAELHFRIDQRSVPELADSDCIAAGGRFLADTAVDVVVDKQAVPKKVIVIKRFGSEMLHVSTKNVENIFPAWKNHSGQWDNF